MDIAGVGAAGANDTVQATIAAMKKLRSASELQGEQAVKLVTSLPKLEQPRPAEGNLGGNVNTFA